MFKPQNLFVLLILGVLAGCSQSSEVKPAADEGNAQISEVSNSIHETVVIRTYWDEAETLLKEEYEAIKGQEHLKHGFYRFYTKSQVLSMEHRYVEGEMQGEIKEFYESGNLWIEYEFTEGAPNGPFTWYHENGTVMLRGTYDNGVYSDTLWEYDELGNLVKMQASFDQFASLNP